MPGFELAETAEPLMRCTRAPTAAAAPFRVAAATRPMDVELAIELTAEAHHVDRSLLAKSIGVGAQSGGREVWLAWDGEEAVSALWLARAGTTIGAMEMMTPARHQRRGAGRCLLTSALTATWDASVDDAVLLATPAGRRLYEAIGFVAVDESRTCFRGLEDGVLGANGQTTRLGSNNQRAG
jgi:Acetyltransferase (GNAT) domain